MQGLIANKGTGITLLIVGVATKIERTGHV